MTDEERMFECIPNFSEGRRPEVLEALRRAAEVPGVRVLGLDADPDHNRAVMTLVGPRGSLLTSVFATIRQALETIDLTRHEGVHPRMGAVDVVPFVPLQGSSEAEAIEMARELGRRVGDELQVPVYFYELAATRPERRNLADVRRGQFEALSVRMAADPPDCGPPEPHPTAGAVAIGARRPLIAFNVYLNTGSMAVARRVAKAVRGSSGGLVGVKALAMDTRNHGRVQVSMNLVDYRTTPLPRALELVREEARQLGVLVVQTELVGFMPFDAVEDAMRYYLQLPGFSRHRVLEVAIKESGKEWGDRE